MSTLGERLKIARDKTGLSQVQVKERTNINNKTLSGYENGVSEPDSKTLATLANLYQVSFEWLATGVGERERFVNGVKNFNDKNLSEKDEKDIAKRILKMRNDLVHSSSDVDGLTFMGEPLSEEATESLLEALEHAERIATLVNKKYAPNKFKNKE